MDIYASVILAIAILVSIEAGRTLREMKKLKDTFADETIETKKEFIDEKFELKELLTEINEADHRLHRRLDDIMKKQKELRVALELAKRK